jgi:hypothetical protein
MQDSRVEGWDLRRSSRLERVRLLLVEVCIGWFEEFLGKVRMSAGRRARALMVNDSNGMVGAVFIAFTMVLKVVAYWC